MSALYWTHPAARLDGYSASSRGDKATLTIKLTISDPHELGYLLSQLAEVKQQERPKPVAPKRRQLLLEHKPGTLVAAVLLAIGVLAAPPARAEDNGALAFWRQAEAKPAAPRWRADIPLPPDVRHLRALVARTASRHGVPPRVAMAVAKVESGYRCHVRSHANARGLMQVLPATARGVGVTGNLYDCQHSATAGVRYLARIISRHGVSCASLSL